MAGLSEDPLDITTFEDVPEPEAATEIRELMRAMYSLYAPALVQPDRLVEVAALLEPWSGKEQELLERVKREYHMSLRTLSSVPRPLSGHNAESELSKQNKYGAAVIRVLQHDGFNPPDFWKEDNMVSIWSQSGVTGNLENLEEATLTTQASWRTWSRRKEKEISGNSDKVERPQPEYLSGDDDEFKKALAASEELELSRKEMRAQQEKLEESQFMQALAESAGDQLTVARAAQERLEKARAAQEELADQLAKARAKANAAEMEHALAAERKRQQEQQENATIPWIDAETIRIMEQHQAERQRVVETEAAEKARQEGVMRQQLQAMKRAKLLPVRHEREEARVPAQNPEWLEATRTELERNLSSEGSAPIWLHAPEPEPAPEPQSEQQTEGKPIWLKPDAGQE